MGGDRGAGRDGRGRAAWPQCRASSSCCWSATRRRSTPRRAASLPGGRRRRARAGRDRPGRRPGERALASRRLARARRRRRARGPGRGVRVDGPDGRRGRRAGLLGLERVPGVLRPAVAATLPADGGPVLLIDAGANVDPRAGAPRAVRPHGHARGRGPARPAGADVRAAVDRRGGRKGNRRRAGGPRAVAARPGLRFGGNIEGHDLLTRRVDVVVTDGFTGNVVLKTAEGTARHAWAGCARRALASTRGRLGGLLLRAAVRELRAEMHPDTYGGAWLVGLDALVVIGHGRSSARRRGERLPLRRGRRATRRPEPPRGASAGLNRGASTSLRPPC